MDRECLYFDSDEFETSLYGNSKMTLPHDVINVSDEAKSKIDDILGDFEDDEDDWMKNL